MSSLGFLDIVYLGAEFVWASGMMTRGSLHTVRCTKWANYFSRWTRGIVLLILNVVKTKQSKTKLDYSCKPQKAYEGKDSGVNKAASFSGEGTLFTLLSHLPTHH